MVIVIMGVSGCGKSTLGRRLSLETGLPFYDADDYHSAKNVRKMSNGIALTDEDRKPWLEKLSRLIAQWERKGGAILACSALRNKYREILRAHCRDRVYFVYLRGSKEIIRRRLHKRKGHFMNPGLLESQFLALEEPTDALAIPVEMGIRQKVSAVITHFGLPRSKNSK